MKDKGAKLTDYSCYFNLTYTLNLNLVDLFAQENLSDQTQWSIKGLKSGSKTPQFLKLYELGMLTNSDINTTAGPQS